MPITAASAKLAFEKASNQLLRACNSLERNLPPSNEDENEQATVPPLAPRRRIDSQASQTGCALCVSELFDLDTADRADHRCTHQQPSGEHRREDDVASRTGSDIGPPRTKAARVKQPAVGVIKEYMVNLDNCLEKYTDAVTVVCSTFTNEAEKILYQDHLIVWNEHCENLKDRARETIFVLEAAQSLAASAGVGSMQQQPNVVPMANSSTNQQVNVASMAITTGISPESSVATMSELVVPQPGPSSSGGFSFGSRSDGSHTYTVPFETQLPPSSRASGFSFVHNPQPQVTSAVDFSQRPPIMSTIQGGTASQAQLPPRSG